MVFVNTSGLYTIYTCTYIPVLHFRSADGPQEHDSIEHRPDGGSREGGGRGNWERVRRRGKREGERGRRRARRGTAVGSLGEEMAKLAGEDRAEVFVSLPEVSQNEIGEDGLAE